MTDFIPMPSTADDPGVLIHLLLLASIGGGAVYAALSLPHAVICADVNRNGRELLKSSGYFTAGAVIAALSIIAFTHAYEVINIIPDQYKAAHKAYLIAVAAFPVAAVTGSSLAIMATAYQYPHEMDDLRADGRRCAIIYLILSISFLSHSTGVASANAVNGPNEGAMQESRPVSTQTDSPTNPSVEIPSENKTLFYLTLGYASGLIMMIYYLGHLTKDMGRKIPPGSGLKETGTNMTHKAFIAAIALTALITYVATK